MFLQDNSAKLALGDSRRPSFVHGHAGRSNSGKEAGAARQTAVHRSGPAGEGGAGGRRARSVERLALAVAGEAIRIPGACAGFRDAACAATAAAPHPGADRSGNPTQRSGAAGRAAAKFIATCGQPGAACG